MWKAKAETSTPVPLITACQSQGSQQATSTYDSDGLQVAVTVDDAGVSSANAHGEPSQCRALRIPLTKAASLHTPEVHAVVSALAAIKASTTRLPATSNPNPSDESVVRDRERGRANGKEFEDK